MLEGAKSWVKTSFNSYIISPIKSLFSRIPPQYKTKEFLVCLGVIIFLVLVILSDY